MQRSRAQVALLSVLLGCASPTLASAQDMYPGQDVTVNTGASGSGVLLYPGGKYGRVVGPLLQPGEPYPGMPEKPIHLHMPYRHVARHLKPKPSVAVASTNPAPASPPPQQQATEPAPSEDMPSSDTAANLAMEAAPPPPAPPPKAAPPKYVPPPKPAPARQVAVNKPKPKPPVPFVTAPAAPPVSAAPQASGGGIPLSLGEEPIQPPAAPTPSASHPMKMAKAEPPPAQSAPRPADEGMGPGLTKQSQIIFASGIADPAPSSIDAIKGLSTPLNSALAAGATRVEIVAYGGARGDKSSDARRLSLRRAIIIRQLLIDGGVPTGSIDVRAMGGANDNEPADRVDIFTKA